MDDSVKYSGRGAFIQRSLLKHHQLTERFRHKVLHQLYNNHTKYKSRKVTDLRATGCKL